MSTRVEVGNSRQARQGAARREREGETRSWPSRMPQHPRGARLPLHTSNSDYCHGRKLTAQWGSREISFRPH